VRDDNRQEIIVAFQGALDIVDIAVGTKNGNSSVGSSLKFQNTDLLIAMSPLKTTGVVDVGYSYVHSGFLLAYNVVAPTVLRTIYAQVAAYPSYKIVVAGHSLGGAIASIAALSIKAALPNTPLKLYTYGGLTSSMPELSKLTIVCTQGQPRTGNAVFASLVERRIGISNIFRAVNTYGTYFRARFL
jgi:pimeloyl-ACP methyl ester carboxylesterase